MQSGTLERRVPARATLVLGAASFGSVLGFVIGGALAFPLFDLELPDHWEYLGSSAMAGAALGWLLGAAGGLNATGGARRPAPWGTWALRIAAVVAAIITILAMMAEGAIVHRQDGITETELPWLRAATTIGGLLVSGTLVSLSFPRRQDRSASSPGRVAWTLSVVGILLGLSLFATIVGAWHVRYDHWTTQEFGRPASRTMSSLRFALEDHHDRTGTYPADEMPLLAAGGRIYDGATIVAAEPFGKGFCLIVAMHGEDGSVVEPFSGVVVTYGERSDRATYGQTDACEQIR
jgi:hypothetical protein